MLQLANCATKNQASAQKSNVMYNEVEEVAEIDCFHMILPAFLCNSCCSYANATINFFRIIFIREAGRFVS